MTQPEIQTIIDQLTHRSPLQRLSPLEAWDRALDDHIAELAAKAERNAVLALLSGLHLWNDSLDRSHTISQELSDATGSYWHGIMHRMEKDYSNAKYWFHQVGNHPAIMELGAEAAKWLSEADELELLTDSEQETIRSIVKGEKWDPYRFVDVVAASEGGRLSEASRGVLEQLQWLEMSSLIRYCAARAANAMNLQV
ncbi:hypothetical protein [Paenibacillus abyssi]|uniref:Uncharacterized protein n=1 Tax=Paenibacillus abyssi TaxID=1340531 RepID=A0A917CUU2_9BACL|nr:hypothetical protein [Paenibacillus abyssi]GGF99666.1 hypothetical protein GCM10010916_16150 [Paenibacillus abyssi]